MGASKSATTGICTPSSLFSVAMTCKPISELPPRSKKLSISAATRHWLIDNIEELEVEALKTETDADDAAVALIKGIFGVENNGPIESAISPEFKTCLVTFLDKLEERTDKTDNEIDDIAAHVLRGLFNIH